MKKIVTLFVAIAAFCGFTSKAEEATTFEVNRIKYTVTGENSVGVSGLNENYEPGEVSNYSFHGRKCGEKLYRHFGRGVRFSVDIGHPENRTSQYRYRAKKQRHLLQR